MLIVKTKFKEHETQNHNFNVESLNALIVLLQMLENDERCISVRIFDSNQFEEIRSLKSNFNISDQVFKKCVNVHPAVKSDVSVNAGALKMALNVLRRAGKDEVADELEKTVQIPAT